MAEVLAGYLAEVPDGAQPLGQRGVAGDDHAALARGDDLVRVEAEAARRVRSPPTARPS